MKYSCERTKIARQKILSVFLFFAILAILLIYSGPCLAEFKGAQYLYNFASFTGTIPYNLGQIAVDDKTNEVYVIYKNEVDIFNEKGMKTYGFGDDEGLSGVIYDIAIAGDGTMFLLSMERDNYFITHCNYRGEPISQVKFRNFPSGFPKFSPTRIVYRSGELYLADLVHSKKVVITDTEGSFKDSYDMNSLLGLLEKAKDQKPGQEKEIGGFSVDVNGDMLLTVPTIFRAFRVSRDRTVQSFGEPGSLPGKFNVVAGIATDDAGNYYIADVLKSVIMVYDKDFNFITQFGHRGARPDNLIAPSNIAVHDGFIYISQARARGVSVFKIIDE